MFNLFYSLTCFALFVLFSQGKHIHPGTNHNIYYTIIQK